MADECNMGMKLWWNFYEGGKTKVLGGKPVPVQLCSPQIQHGMACDRTTISEKRCQRL